MATHVRYKFFVRFFAVLSKTRGSLRNHDGNGNGIGKKN